MLFNLRGVSLNGFNGMIKTTLKSGSSYLLKDDSTVLAMCFVDIFCDLLTVHCVSNTNKF